MLQLGAGEVECISLAVELQADCVLLDDLAARDEAKRLRLATVGTLGILADAHRKGWLNFEAQLARLRALNYRASPAVIAQVHQTL
jgi:predicted nucleic acid-binding protein